MAVTRTQVSAFSWTDFSAPAIKTVTLSQSIAVGHRAFLILGSTVDGGVAAGAVNWGGIDSLRDQMGHVWTRDNFGGPVDATNVNTTIEVWSTYVKRALPTTLELYVTPDVRGLSANVVMFDVTGLAENNGASVLDQVASANNSGTSFGTGTTGTLAQASEWVLEVFAMGSDVTDPWLTFTDGATSEYQTSSSGSGSTRALAVGSREVSATTAVTGSGTTLASQTGAGCITTYKIGSPAADVPDFIQKVQKKTNQTNNTGATCVVSLDNATVVGHGMTVAISGFKSGGANPFGTTPVTDSKGNTWTLIKANHTTAGGYHGLWHCPALTSAGSGHTVTITANATAFITGQVMEWSGFLAGTPLDQSNTNTGSSASATPGSITTAVDAELYLMVVSEDSSVTTIPPSGFVKEDEILTGQDIHVYWQIHTAQTINPAVTLASSTGWGSSIGSLKASTTSSVTKTLTASYNVKQQIVKTVSASYTVKIAIAKTLSTSYTVHKAIVKTLVPAYNVIQRIAKTLTASYGILATPVNITPPVISGSPLSGQLLSTTNGTWTNSPTGFTYQWQVETGPGTGVYSDIPGETASTLQL